MHYLNSETLHSDIRIKRREGKEGGFISNLESVKKKFWGDAHKVFSYGEHTFPPIWVKD